jgi:tetratricopeptide (TPR) repeat protein
VPFLHFHPVLLPALRQEAATQGEEAEEERALRQRYAQRYAAVAAYLHREAYQHPEPVFALVQRELPNLRKALEWLVQAGDMEAASLMAADLTIFLTAMGLTRERERVRRRLEQALATVPAQADGGLTQAEYLQEIGRAQDERGSGKVQAAFARLTRLLARIQALPDGADDGPGSFSHCYTLQELGYCLQDAGQLESAADKLREALELLEQQPEDRDRRRLHASLLENLGTILILQGQYAQVQARYEHALQEFRAIDDTFNEAATLGQLGTLAQSQRDYPQARTRHMQALKHFQALGDPAQQAVSWHQLGRVAQEQQAWTEAERCYRESLALEERIGDIAGAADTCNQLGNVAVDAGRPTEAEGWYKGALERIERVEPGGMTHAIYLNNLASLLVNEVRAGRVARSRLVEARRYAQQAQSIWEQPGVSAEIWMTYAILAKIAELEEQPDVARDYRRQERESFAAFAGNRYQIDRQHSELIGAIVAAARGDAQAQATVAAALPALEKHGWHISDAVRRIWKGERDWQGLAEELDRQDALLILRVLETLASPPGTPLSQEEAQTTEHLLASLPLAIQEAITQGDEVAFQLAFEALSQEEQQKVATVLEMLQGQEEAVGEQQAVPDGSSFLSQFEPLLQAIATVAQGDPSQRDEIEEMLTELEGKGWHLKAAVQRPWTGERDTAVLTAGLDEQDTLLVVHMGAILAAQRDTRSSSDGERS